MEKLFPDFFMTGVHFEAANLEMLSRRREANSKKNFLKHPMHTCRKDTKEPLLLNVNRVVSDMFNLYPEAQILGYPDLFGGKICAALDRQHPRDFFDILMMFENNLFSEEIRKVFLVYLLQTNRPIAELLEPTRIDFKNIYENEFLGMIREDVSRDQLYETREQLIDRIKAGLSSEEKEFLLSFKQGEPLWEKLGIGDFSYLPGIKWKLLNIKRMTGRKKKESYNILKAVLETS